MSDTKNVSDGHILFEHAKRIWKEKRAKGGAPIAAPPLETTPVPASVQLPGAPPARFGADVGAAEIVHLRITNIVGFTRGKSKEGARRPPLGHCGRVSKGKPSRRGFPLVHLLPTFLGIQKSRLLKANTKISHIFSTSPKYQPLTPLCFAK